jgi:hypothetical protein
MLIIISKITVPPIFKDLPIPFQKIFCKIFFAEKAEAIFDTALMLLYFLQI